MNTFRLMEVVRRGSVNNYYGPAQVTQVCYLHLYLRKLLILLMIGFCILERNSAHCVVSPGNQERVCWEETQGGGGVHEGGGHGGGQARGEGPGGGQAGG